MKNKILAFFALFMAIIANAQEKELPKQNDLLKSSSEKACKCLDSISYKNSKDSTNKFIQNCIEKQTMPYMVGTSLINAAETATKTNQKKINVNLNMNKNSQEFKKAYYEIQNYMMGNCKEITTLVSSVESKSENSVSKNSKAIDYYNIGLAAKKKENYEDAISFFEKALKEDPNFAFAWDNIGICYRKLEKLDKALYAYKKSLSLDPKGKMPLQNIPVVYVHMKEYQKAIGAFKDLDAAYPGDAEVYYGIGQIYYQYLQEYEKSLDYMCKAFNIYTKENSPYRSDAENIIALIYKKMKEQGNLNKFNEILKSNDIKPVLD